MKKYVLFEQTEFGTLERINEYAALPSEKEVMVYATEDTSEYFILEVIGRYCIKRVLEKIED